MPKRSQQNRNELRQSALKAVKDFLSLYSPQQMSLRKIAKLVDYAPASIINCFGSYDELLMAANAETLDELYLLSSVAVREEANPQTALRRLARIYLGYARKYPHRWHLAFEHRIPEQQALPEWQQQRIDRLFALFTEQLSRLCPRRKLQDIHVASRVIWAGVHGVCLLSAGSGAIIEKHSTGEQMIDSFLGNYMSAWMKENRLSTAC